MKKPDIGKLLINAGSINELVDLGMEEEAAEYILNQSLAGIGAIHQLMDAAIEYEKRQSAPKKCVVKRKKR